MKHIIIEVIRKNKKDQWHSRIKAPNGEIIWSGEERKGSFFKCEKTIRGFIKLFKEKTYKIKIIDNGKTIHVQ